MAKQLNVNLAVTADTSQAKAQLQQLQSTLQQLKSTPITLGTDMDLSKTLGQVGQLQHLLQQATNTETGVLNFTKLNSSIKASGTSLQDYGKTLLSLGPQGRDAFNQLATAVSKAQVPVLNLNSTFSQLWTTMKNTMRWQLSSSAFHAVLGTIQSAWNYAQNLNESLTRIQIVTKQSDEQMIKFAESANKAAQSLGTTTTAYTNAALIYYQQGLNNQQVKERTDVTVKMANVTGQTAQQVSDQMTAIWNNFDDGSHSLEYYADVITALGAATASSSEEISKGLQKFAAIADTVGLSYENATAALATIVATTRQSADSVGTGLRTLFSRLQSLSLGETLEDGVNLTKYSKALKTVGVEALDAQGNLRQMDDVLADLGEKWQGLTDAQKTALAQTVGGVRQYTTLMALMENNDFFKQNQQIAKSSAGELSAQEAIYEKSWKAAQKRLRASAESIYSDVIDDQFFIGLSDTLSGLLKILDNFIDGLGGVKGLIFSIVAAVTTLNKAGSTKFFNSVIDSAKALTPKGRQMLYQQQQAEITGFQEQLRAQQEYASPTTIAQINSIGYNLSAQSEYLRYKNGYTESQDLQAQTLLQNLEAVNGALIKTAQNFETLSGQTADVRAAFTQLVGKDFSAEFFKSQDFKDFTAMKSQLGAYGIATGEAGFIQAGDFESKIAQVQAISKNIGTISDKGLSNAFSQLLNSTSIESWNAAILAVDDALTSLSMALNDAAIAAMGEEASETKQRAASEKAAAAIQHEIKVRESNTRMQELEKQGNKIPGMFANIAQSPTGQATTGQYVSEGMSILSNTAMGISMLKGSFGQIQSAMSGQGSWGDALLSAGTTLPFAAMMFRNAKNNLEGSALLNNLFAKTTQGKLLSQNASNAYLGEIGQSAYNDYIKNNPIVRQNPAARAYQIAEREKAAQQAVQAARGTEEAVAGAEAVGTKAVAGAGLGAKLGSIAAAAGPYVVAIAAVAATIWAVSDLIVTSKERYEQLNKQLEINKQRVSDITQKYQTLNNNFSKQKQLDEQIKQSQVGSVERNAAILEANTNAQQIITDNHLTSADYTIQNGQIVFNTGVEESLQRETLKEMQQVQRQLLLTQGAVATAKTEMDYDSFMRSFNYDAWVQKHSEYGYTSGEEAYKAYLKGDMRDQMMLRSGAAQQNVMALQQMVLDQYGAISDADSFLINKIAQDPSFYDQIDFENSINTSGFAALHAAVLGKLNNFGESEDTERLAAKNMTLNELKRYASANYGDQYRDLIESDEYKNAKRKEKRRLLADLIETNRREEKISERFKEQQKELQSFQEKYGNGTSILAQSGEQLFSKDGAFGQLIQGELTGANKDFAQEYLKQYHEAQTNYLELGNELGLNMADAYGKHTAEEAQKIFDTAKQFQTSFGNDFAKQIFETLDAGQELGALGELELTGNTITDLKTLKESKLINEKTGKTYFEEAKASLGGEKGLLETLYDSEGFKDSLADLQELFKNTGEISAENILEAAESCQELSDYLEISGVNAQGLADALEMVELGDISSIDQLSDGLLRALSIAGELKSNLAEAYAHIDKFDAGRSANDILKFSQELGKNITGSFDTGLFLDEPLLNSWEEMFGSESRTDYVNAAREFAAQGMSKTEIQDALKNRFDKQFELFDQLTTATDMMPVFEYGLKNTDAYNDYFRIIDGQFQVNEKNLLGLIDQKGGLDNLYADMAEKMNISEDMAKEMFAHMAQSYPSIKDAIEKNNLNKALEQGLFETGETVNAQGMRAFLGQYKDVISGMTQAEFAKALGISTEGLKDFNGEAKMTAEMGLEMLRQKAKETGAEIIDLGKDFDYTNSTFEDLEKAWNNPKNRNEKDIKDYFSSAHTETKDNGDIDKSISDVDILLGKYAQLGITGAAAYKMIDGQMEKYGETLVRNQRDISGALVQTQQEAGESTADFIARSQRELDKANQQWANQDLADKIAESLGDITVTFNGDTGPLKDMLKNEKFTATVILSGDASAITEAINAAIAAAGAGGGASGGNTGGNNSAGCFVAGTKILLASNQEKNIEDIQIGDLVISYNEQDKQYYIDQVTETFIHNNIPQLVTVYFDNNSTIEMTLGHPLLSTQGWKSLDIKTSKEVHNVDATLLNINDEIIFYNEIHKIINIEIRNNYINQLVYNFSTKKYHTYLANNIITHNKFTGYNNAKGFAGGLHSNGQYEGPAIVGELGPEAWVHNGQVDLVGRHGREMIYLHKDDQIFTAAQTREMPGFEGGKNNDGWHGGGYGDSGKSNANTKNAKTSKYDPERYHLITRQLKDLQREYDRLDKIKENCYGTNKLEAIQREIDATNDLIKGQKQLIKEAEDYLEIDKKRLKSLLSAGEFQLDANGNLLNFEALQEKYRRKAEEDKDEHAQDVWKALQQYEETLDKLQEANVEMQDLLYQEMELRLEKITTKAELKIDFDEREIKLLDHYIKRIDDNIYHTAEVLALTEQKLGHINQKIEDTKEGINGLFTELSDSQGNKITKADGTAYTLEDWLAMSNKERDLLDINDNFGKQLEEYMDNLLDYIEELEEFKTKGVEEFGEAFSELNDNVRSSIDLFDHYNSLLSSLKNITDLQGVKLSAEMRAAMKEIDAAMFNNTQNNIDAERENYRRLNSQVAELRQKIADTQDETLKKQWEEQLKVAEEELRTSEQNLLSLWETGLQQAKDMFETALQDAADEYEATIAGMYGTTDELQKAWNQQKKNDDFYVKDFEKYYQIQKLQRSITKDLDAAARAGNKQNQGLKKLFDELNDARENGVELSSYDLDIFAKRYEYEKALMELEDARNNKSEVRLQRDANGNWGYVYTSSADDDDLIAKQQAVDDKFYELQKATQERVAALSDDMMSEITGVGARLQELYSSGASEETIAKYLEQESKYIENYRQALAKALEDAGMTEEEARLRYGNEGFDILDQFSETLLSSITGGNESLDEFFARVQAAMEGTNHDMEAATGEYQDSMDAINKWFNESGEDLATVIHGFASVISEESKGNLLDSKEQIQNAKDTFDEILKVATQFEQKFLEIYQPIIDANEQLVADLLKALHALNREEYEGPDHSSNSNTSIGDIIGDIESSGEGSGGSGENPGGNKVFSKYSDWESNDNKHWRYAIYTDGSKYKTDEGYHQWVIDAGDHWEDDKHYNSRTCQICKKRKWWYSYRGGGSTGGGCFEAGTQIIMADNSIKNIEDIQVNDYVYAYNEQTGIFEIHQVIKSYVHHHTPRVISVVFSNGLVLNMTPGHPILTTEGWKSRDIENSLIEHNTLATWLNIGDTIINISNDIIQIVDIQEKNIPDNFDTYNIEVETCHTFLVNGLVVHNAKTNMVMERMATGGYTGAWGPEGRMAILDEKELVLNKDDTKNFLDATAILRTIDLQTNLFSKGLSGIITPWIDDMKSQALEQDVHIEASFPNVTDHNEIELAFDNLINKASQYANRKNMSSMTFQDMYTSKF